MWCPRCALQATELGSCIYAFGGIDSGSLQTSWVEKYDLLTNTWEVLPDVRRQGCTPMQKMSCANVVASPSGLYAAYEEIDGWCGARVVLERYDVKKGRWQEWGRLPIRRGQI